MGAVPVCESLTNATMTFEKAKQEFQVRYYLWAISEWEKEINESFPNLRSFKAGTIWETYQFMQLLDKSQQLVLAHGLLKRSHPEAVKILRENCSREEESLRSRRDDFFRLREFYLGFQRLKRNGQMAEAHGLFQVFRADAAKIVGETYFNDDKSLLSQLDAIFVRIPLTFEEEIAAKKQAGEKIKFASKRKLQKTLTEKFRVAFGDQCIDHKFDDEFDLSSNFDMKCCGWILSTNFWFGRRESLINYSHGIGSETRVTHPESKASASAMAMAQMISFSSWLGITSQIQWEYLMNDDVVAASDAVLRHCHRFIEVAPKLLQGLEFEKITSE